LANLQRARDRLKKPVQEIVHAVSLDQSASQGIAEVLQSVLNDFGLQFRHSRFYLAVVDF
jgi:hypothetical protein